MDAAAGAYAEGAEQVTCIDVQRPAAFAREIAHIEALGGRLIWPVQTKEVTEEGIVASDGRIIPGDMVIITIGDEPEIDFLPQEVRTFRKNWVVPGNDRSILPGVFAAGDVIRPGLLTAAVGSGREAAMSADAWMRGAPRGLPAKREAAGASLHPEYFSRMHEKALPAARDDWQRCISCGTCRDCGMCLDSCPEQAISRIETEDDTGYAYASDPERCIGCGVCTGVCPCGVWTLRDNEPLN
jgi:ferredoxin